MKVKIFEAGNSGALESEVNQWLQDNSWVKINTITQSSSSKTVISIWYQEPDVPILG